MAAANMRSCLICPDQHYGLGFCRLHYRRKVKGQDLNGLNRFCSWRPVKTSHTAHKRVYRLWGKAAQYSCIECGGPAKQWAYDGTDPTQGYGPTASAGQYGKYWSFFSSYPEFYMPMCSRCHSRRDGSKAQQELREYRLWKQLTGLSLADLEMP